MTEKELTDMEAAMTKEMIIERAKTLRPLADFRKLGGMRYWLDGNKIHSTSYNWDKKRLKPTGYLRELGRVKTYHTGTRFFFKPSVEEMVVQCPYPEATAFMYVEGTCDYDYEQDIWTAETIYYTGDMPEEIRNMEIKW